MSKQIRPVSFLEFLPVSFFGIVMSLSGLSFSWGWAEKLWNVPAWPNEIAKVLALVCFVLITIVYLIKWIKYPALIKAEFNHPVSVSFYGTFIISLLLIPGIILSYSVQLATVIWCCGAVLIFIFSWGVLRKLLDQQQEPANALPAWVIPIVGTLDAPVVGYRLPIAAIHEICLMFFSVGIIFGIIFLILILSRLLFQPPLPVTLQPTLLILIGPFALAYSGYESLTGSQDTASAIFYYFDLFLLLILLSKIILIPKCCPFNVTWWAVGFPLVAITIASFRYAGQKSNPLHQIIPGSLLAFSTLVIFYLLCQTLYLFFTWRFTLSKPFNQKDITTSGQSTVTGK